MSISSLFTLNAAPLEKIVSFFGVLRRLPYDSRAIRIFSAIREMTGTVTEFPTCL